MKFKKEEIKRNKIRIMFHVKHPIRIINIEIQIYTHNIII